MTKTDLELLQFDYATEKSITDKMRREHNFMEELIAEMTFDPETGVAIIPKSYRTQLVVFRQLIKVRSSCSNIKRSVR